jgi:hypothetical protein
MFNRGLKYTYSILDGAKIETNEEIVEEEISEQTDDTDANIVPMSKDES